MTTTVEALQAWNDHPPVLPLRIPCPIPSCKSKMLVGPWKKRLSLRTRARMTMRMHLLKHYQIGVRERSLLLDAAVEGL